MKHPHPMNDEGVQLMPLLDGRIVKSEHAQAIITGPLAQPDEAEGGIQ